MVVFCYALFVILVHPVQLFADQPRKDECRDNRDEFGFALAGHDYKSTNADNFGRCFFECSLDERCQSATFLWNTKECKMKNETKKSRPADFEENPAATYMENSFRAKKGSKASVPGFSCKDIMISGDAQGDGEYWIDPTASGRPFTVYCYMVTDGAPIGSKSHPGHSCKDIRESGESRGDGEYWIDPEKNGNPLKVFCDMTTDGGGWLLISNLVLQSSTPPSQVPVNSSYRGISSDQMLLTKSAMTELRTHLSFTQLRFHCSIQQGRTFHVTTVVNSAGDAVVRYFSGQRDNQPASCGSFVRMEGDNSGLVGVCRKWGFENNVYRVGKWGHDRDQDRLYYYPAFVAATYHWHIDPPTFLCDDSHLVGFSAGDFWKVFVR